MTKPKFEEFERGLTHESWWVRAEFAERIDFTPTPAQIERGLTDSDVDVREIFERRKAEWTARLEAHELKQRHATATAIKPKMEAL